MDICRVKKREKVAYGMGDLGNNIAYGAVGFYFVFFLTDVAGLSPLWAGNIFMIIRLWNAFSDLIMGIISDKTRSKYGRRRPFLLYGALPLGICFALLWMVPFDSKQSLIIYYAIAGFLFNTLYSFVAIPYNALLPEMSQDYDERTSISGYKMAFSFIGSLLSAMGVTLIVDVIYSGKLQYQVSFPVMGRILAGILVICIIIAFLGTQERVKIEDTQSSSGIFKSIISLIKLKEYRYVLGVFLFNMVAFDIIMVMYIYYMKYALNISDDFSSIFMAIPLISAVVATPFWVSLSNKIGKKKTYIVSTFYFMIPLVVCLILPANTMLLTLIITVMIGIGISASQVLIFSILPDVVEVDQQKNGEKREGIIYGVTMFLYKIGSAFIIAAVTAMMGMFGYIESNGIGIVKQTESAIIGIRVLMSLAPIFCLLLTIISISRLKLDKQSSVL